MARVCLLPNRSVFQIVGPEAKSFLQDLLTNNLDLVSPEQAIYTCLLTPQGKYLFDFFLTEKEGAYLVDCDRDAAPLLLKRLMFYKLRADVQLKDLHGSWSVGAVLDDEVSDAGVARTFNDGTLFQDPRLAQLGARFLVPNEKANDTIESFSGSPVDASEYEHHRLTLGVPGHEDLQPDKTFPMEANLDALNAIDFHKGCFVGQEVTSRTYRQGKVRKRMLPVTCEGRLPPIGTPIMADDRQSGELLSSQGNIGLALVRLDRLETPLTADGAPIEPRFPDWLPQPTADDAS